MPAQDRRRRAAPVGSTGGEDPRARTREALLRHAEIDACASGREQIGAQIGLLGMILAIILVGALPVAEAVRIPFMTVAFVGAFYVGLSVKRFLDERSGR